MSALQLQCEEQMLDDVVAPRRNVCGDGEFTRQALDEPGSPPTRENTVTGDADKMRVPFTPAQAMTEPTSLPTLPDRLSTDPRSPHHVAAVFEHEIGIRLNGNERHDVEEYCISEGWVKVPSGKTKDRKGQPLLITLKGKVEAFYR